VGSSRSAPARRPGRRGQSSMRRRVVSLPSCQRCSMRAQWLLSVSRGRGAQLVGWTRGQQAEAPLTGDRPMTGRDPPVPSLSLVSCADRGRSMSWNLSNRCPVVLGRAAGLSRVSGPDLRVPIVSNMGWSAGGCQIGRQRGGPSGTESRSVRPVGGRGVPLLALLENDPQPPFWLLLCSGVKPLLHKAFNPV
jgi:hypothetical protein